MTIECFSARWTSLFIVAWKPSWKFHFTIVCVQQLDFFLILTQTKFCTINKEFIDLRKKYLFEEMCVFDFSNLALVCISYHCRPWYAFHTTAEKQSRQSGQNGLPESEQTNKRLDMSRLMTKPTKWVGAQRRLRSAWASAQSDQSLRFTLNG